MRLTRIAIASIAAAVLASRPAPTPGDAFIVGGLQLHPTENIDVGNRWLLSGGSDYHLTHDGPILAGSRSSSPSTPKATSAWPRSTFIAKRQVQGNPATTSGP